MKSPITQGSANKSRSVVSSPAAQKEFNAINQMFQDIDATALDMEPTEKAKPTGAEKEKEKGTSKSTGTTKKATKAKGKEMSNLVMRVVLKHNGLEYDDDMDLQVFASTVAGSNQGAATDETQVGCCRWFLGSKSP